MIYEGAPQNNLACVPWDSAPRVMQEASDSIPNQDLCTAVTDTYTWDPWCATSTEGDVPGAVYDDWAYCTAPGLHFYMDGTLQLGNYRDVGVMGTDNDEGPLVVNDNSVRIGKSGSTTLTTSAGAPIDEYFTGWVDNLRIYTKKLSHHDAHAIFTCEGGAEVMCDTDSTTGSTSAGATAAAGTACVFPFTYMGQEFNHCTDQGVPGYPEDIHTRLWCATEAVCDDTPCGGAEDVANGGCVNTCQWANCVNCYSSYAQRPEVITNIATSSSECTPVASRLMLDSPYYCDRGYVFTDIPGFLGGTAIITTANNDKQADASDTVSSLFTVHVLIVHCSLTRENTRVNSSRDRSSSASTSRSRPPSTSFTTSASRSRPGCSPRSPTSTRRSPSTPTATWATLRSISPTSRRAGSASAAVGRPRAPPATTSWRSARCSCCSASAMCSCYSVVAAV
jgi:hypothetical protein